MAKRHEALETLEVPVGTAATFPISLDSHLDKGVTGTGTPTVAQYIGDTVSTDLTISNIAFNAAIIDVGLNEDIPIGRVLLFFASGFVLNKTYTLVFTYNTSQTPTNIRIVTVKLKCVKAN